MKYYTLRINDELIKEFRKFCKKKDLKVSIIIKHFMTYVIKNEYIPDIIFNDKNYIGKTDRICIKVNEDINEQFDNICKQNYFSKSVVIRPFIDYCVTNNQLPY